MYRLRLVLFPVLLAIFAGGAYWKGQVDCHAARDQEQLAHIEAGRMLEAERRRLRTARDKLSREQERKAHAQAPAVQHCLGPRRVRRLNALR
jgi:hypothetical protein